MKIKRAALIRHLQRIHCNKQITEAVFKEGFATDAMTPDHQLLVSAPSLPGTEALAAPVGIAGVETVISSLNVLAGEGPEAADVEVRVEDNRLVIDENYRGVIRLLTAAPHTIGTRVEDATVAKLMSAAPRTPTTGPARTAPKTSKKGKAAAAPPPTALDTAAASASAPAGVIPLTQALIAGVRSTFKLFKAAEVELFVGPKGGKIRVGNDNSDVVEFASAELKAPEEYSLLFGAHLIDVLGVITDYSEAYLALGGPQQFITIADGAYRYVLSPRSVGADEK